MKAKILVPEIDRKRWAKEFKKRIRSNDLKTEDLMDLGPWINTAQNINKYKNGSLPSMDSFLAFCRFFNCPPDDFLFAKPKWVECEIDCSIDDIVLARDENVMKRIIGQYKGVLYIVPNCEEPEPDFSYCRKEYKIKELRKEPNPKSFSKFHMSGTRYDLDERVVDGKINYRSPFLKKEEISEKIFSIFEKHGLSNKQIKNLLGLTTQSLWNRKKKKQEWTKGDIYKLSWIFNRPFEDFLEFDYKDRPYKYKSLWDPIVFIMHYEGEEEDDDAIIKGE